MTARGTSNTNARGNTADRAARRAWLVETFRADVDVVGYYFDAPVPFPRVAGLTHVNAEPACRCYRCGTLLTVDTVTADRVIPGCQGGTYRRNNLRPACGPCNSSTGSALARRGAARKAA